MKHLFSFLILTICSLYLTASDIFAIPAFARKYNMTCKTCHSPFPKLKDYGDEFAANGFVLKDQDAPRYYLETGDDKLTLLRDFPIAARLEGYLTYNKSNTEKSDFTTPVLFKLLSGGAITQDVAYYVYYILENGEAGKIEDAWLMFNNLFGSGLDVSFGQFQVSDPVFKRELRLTREDYLIYKLRPGSSIVDLTYDRGVIISYGFSSGTDITIEILNGNGIGEGVLGNFDSDKYKNLFGRISQDAGEHLRAGVLGYWGKEEQRINTSETDFHFSQNKLWMAGADATISFEPLELNLQYVHRNDDNPSFADQSNSAAISYIKTNGGFAELIYKPNGDDSNWYGAAIYNLIDSDQDNLDIKSGSIHLGYLYSRNIRMILEYNHNFTEKFGTINAGFVTAF